MTAADNLARLKAAVGALGIKFFEPPPAPQAVGIGVAWSESEFLLASCAHAASDLVHLTCGVLKDVLRNANAALQETNHRNRLYPFAPLFVDGQDDGWDVLQQLSVPADVLVESPRMLSFYLNSLPVFAQDAKGGFASRGLGGTPYAWNEPDLQRLLRRSAP